MGEIMINFDDPYIYSSTSSAGGFSAGRAWCGQGWTKGSSEEVFRLTSPDIHTAGIAYDILQWA